MAGLASIFVYLEEQPLLWLFVTLSLYLLAEQVHRIGRGFALLNPVLVSAVLIAAVLWLSGTSYADYFAGAQFIHVMLGPAIIALAVPVARHKSSLWRARYAVLCALWCGAVVAALSAVLLAKALGLPDQLVASLAPKSVTAPIAMGIAEQLGGITSVAAVLAVVTGITGAVIVTPLFTALGFADWRARGFAVGWDMEREGARFVLEDCEEAADVAAVLERTTVDAAYMLPPQRVRDAELLSKLPAALLSASTLLELWRSTSPTEVGCWLRVAPALALKDTSTPRPSLTYTYVQPKGAKGVGRALLALCEGDGVVGSVELKGGGGDDDEAAPRSLKDDGS